LFVSHQQDYIRRQTAGYNNILGRKESHPNVEILNRTEELVKHE